MFGMRELIAYLAQFEISPRRAMEVFRTFGPGAMTAIQQNPYLLCGEPLQLDFRHADSIAQYYQMAGDCAQRLEAALLRTLRHNAGNGHTCLPRTQLLETAAVLLVLSLDWLFFYYMPGYSGAVERYLWFVLPTAALTIPVCLVLFGAVRRIHAEFKIDNDVV